MTSYFRLLELSIVGLQTGCRFGKPEVFIKMSKMAGNVTSWKFVQIHVILRLRRRPIDHRVLWTGVGANWTCPAYTAAHSMPANRLRIR